MLRAALKYRFWVILVCLLALCLPRGSTIEQPVSGSLDNSGDGPQKVLFASVTTNASSILQVSEKRTRFQSIDNLLAVIHRQVSIVSKSVSFPFLSDESAEVTHCADKSAIPIRAPPICHS
jgi:hypothetical protein